MKTASFENSVSVLVNAYMNDTLEHGCPCGCAVGNLMRASGYQFENPETLEGYDYLLNHKNCSWVDRLRKRSGYDAELADKQIASTGYTERELSLIETAFENAPIEDRDDKMIDGLLAVVDVLAEIHNVDLSVKESAKQLFVKA